MNCWCDELENYKCSDCEHQKSWKNLNGLEKNLIKAFFTAHKKLSQGNISAKVQYEKLNTQLFNLGIEPFEIPDEIYYEIYKTN